MSHAISAQGRLMTGPSPSRTDDCRQLRPKFWILDLVDEKRKKRGTTTSNGSYLLYAHYLPYINLTIHTLHSDRKVILVDK